MSCIQFFVAGLLGIIPMFVFENPQIMYTWKGKEKNEKIIALDA